MRKYVVEVKATLLVESEADLETISEAFEENDFQVSFKYIDGKIVRSTVNDYQVLEPSII